MRDTANDADNFGVTEESKFYDLLGTVIWENVGTNKSYFPINFKYRIYFNVSLIRGLLTKTVEKRYVKKYAQVRPNFKEEIG